MKTLLLLGLLLLATCANAAQFEIGAGIARAQTNGNGTWYQDGFAHAMKLTQPALELGARGRLTSHMDWHVDAVSLGRYSVNSQDTPRDSNYSATSRTHCNGRCLPLANYIGSGRVLGIQALLSRHTRGAWQLGVEAGPFLYHETWRMDVPNWYPPSGPITPISTYGSQWAVGAVLGATLANGPWQLALRYYSDGAGFAGHAGGWPPLWRGQVLVMLSRSFWGAL